jgi:hypothetical protein
MSLNGVINTRTCHISSTSQAVTGEMRVPDHLLMVYLRVCRRDTVLICALNTRKSVKASYLFVPMARCRASKSRPL